MSAVVSVFQERKGNRQTGETSWLQIMYHDLTDRDPFCVLFFLFSPSLCHLFLLLWELWERESEIHRQTEGEKQRGKERKWGKKVRMWWFVIVVLLLSLIQPTSLLPPLPFFFPFFISSCSYLSPSLHSLYLHPLLHLPSLYLCE